MDAPAPRAVIFDLDGTLVDSERVYGAALARALADGQGVALTDDDTSFIIGRSWVAIDAHLRGRYPALTWTRDQIIAACAEMAAVMFREHGLPVLPGALAAVARFADRRRALVTGSARQEAHHVLGHLGLTEAFEVRLCAEDVARSKPAPDGYLAACATLGVAPCDTLVIEDSASGIAAARAAGCAVIAVRAGNFSGQDQSAADLVVDTLDQVTVEVAAQVARAAARRYGGERSA
ncbi:MAG TPA: HAD family phosphatase [Kofleriaceae bacterium]|nr:HAD family phosphatase [Kofleriaceae bacterium]